MSQSIQSSAQQLTELRRQMKARQQNPALAQQAIAELNECIDRSKAGIVYWEKAGNTQNVIECRKALKQAEQSLSRLQATLSPPPDDAA